MRVNNINGESCANPGRHCSVPDEPGKCMSVLHPSVKVPRQRHLIALEHRSGAAYSLSRTGAMVAAYSNPAAPAPRMMRRPKSATGSRRSLTLA
jgi:hypothetical protein